MKIRFINLIYKACSCIVISVFLINISKYHLKSVTFLATTIFIVIHTSMQETLFNLRVKLHSYLQTQFIQPTIDRDKYSMSRSIQTNTFILKKTSSPCHLPLYLCMQLLLWVWMFLKTLKWGHIEPLTPDKLHNTYPLVYFWDN